MPTINARDTSFYVEKTGNGPTTLLFIHGMCGGAWSWASQVERLSGQFTCVTYDRRGHGRSSAGVAGQDYTTHADDAAALIQAMELDQPIVVGSSAGGNIALELLHRHPQLVQGAVVSEPPLLALDPEPAEALIAQLTPRLDNALERNDPRSAVDEFFKVVCAQYWAGIDESQRDRLRDNAPLLFKTLQAEAPRLSAADLTTLTHPILVVSGSDSLPVALSITRKLAGLLPNARVVEFSNCGHVTYAEQPDAFAGAVTAFAREITGVPSSAGATATRR